MSVSSQTILKSHVTPISNCMALIFYFFIHKLLKINTKKINIQEYMPLIAKKDTGSMSSKGDTYNMQLQYTKLT